MKGITWLASYPKSGNTWLRVFLANLRAGGRAPAHINRLHTTQFAARELLDRTIGWETSELGQAEWEALRLPTQEALAAQGAEVPVKTHEAFADPRDGKPRFSRTASRGAIYVVRNPLDVAVSLSHYWGKSVDVAIAFMNDPRAELAYGPNGPQVSQLLCDWSTHVRSWMDGAGMPVCVLRYEDMLAFPEKTFEEAARAAGLSTQPADVAGAVARSGFEQLQRQEAENGFLERTTKRVFFRAGRSGEGREKLTARQVDLIIERHGEIMRRFGYLDSPGQVVARLS